MLSLTRLFSDMSSQSKCNIRPSVKPSTLKVGDRRTGADGLKWVVCKGARGHYWKHVPAKSKSKRKRAQPVKRKRAQPVKRKRAPVKKRRKKSYFDRIRGSESDILAKEVICMTGKMWKPRQILEEFFTRHGARVTLSLSKRNTLLVVGNGVSDNAKLKKAREFHIDRWAADDLQKYLNGE